MDRWTVDVASEWQPPDPVLQGLIETAVLTVLREEDAEEAEISVALLSDEAIRVIHRDYLSDDTPTDVITFPLREPGRPLVGDVYIGAERASEQARENGIPVREEFVRLAVHATLHLLGWDHPDGEDRATSPMYVRQEELVKAVLGSNQ